MGSFGSFFTDFTRVILISQTKVTTTKEYNNKASIPLANRRYDDHLVLGTFRWRDFHIKNESM